MSFTQKELILKPEKQTGLQFFSTSDFKDIWVKLACDLRINSIRNAVNAYPHSASLYFCMIALLVVYTCLLNTTNF